MRIAALFGVAFLLTIVGYVFSAIYKSSTEVGYAPEQPIPFSHKLHAGQNKIECMYCHQNVDKSRHATVPAMEVCMGCHQHVARDSVHIKKMHELNEKGESFKWVKIHDLPEHVYFPHRLHIAAGVKCQTCHGSIEEMDKVVQKTDFTMGYCLACHRDNNYVNKGQDVGALNYKATQELMPDLGDESVYKSHDEVKSLIIDPSTHMNAGTDCSICHQ